MLIKPNKVAITKWCLNKTDDLFFFVPPSGALWNGRRYVVITSGPLTKVCLPIQHFRTLDASLAGGPNAS